MARFSVIGDSGIPSGWSVTRDKAAVWARSAALPKGAKGLIDAGAVGQPRDKNPKAAVCIVDTVAGAWRLKRVAYDTAAARKAVHQMGMPRRYGDRLLYGQ